MSKPNVVKRINDVIQSSEVKTIDLTGSKQANKNNLEDYSAFKNLETEEMTSVVFGDMMYFTKKNEDLNLKPVTNWVVVDLANEHGRKLLNAALKQVVRLMMGMMMMIVMMFVVFVVLVVTLLMIVVVILVMMTMLVMIMNMMFILLIIIVIPFFDFDDDNVGVDDEYDDMVIFF